MAVDDRSALARLTDFAKVGWVTEQTGIGAPRLCRPSDRRGAARGAGLRVVDAIQRSG